MKDPQAQDSHYIKLTGKAEISEPLLIGHNYGVAIEGSITAKTESDNHDGSYNYSYKFEPVLVGVLSEKGETIKVKDIRKKSQQLRAALYKEWAISENNQDFETEYYPERMRQIIVKVIEGEL